MSKYDQRVFAGLAVTPDFLDQSHLESNPSLAGDTVSLYKLGCCCFGALFALIIGEPLGWKRGIVFGTVILAAGTLPQIAAFNVPQMIVGRGLSQGLAMASIHSRRRSGRLKHAKSTGEESCL